MPGVGEAMWIQKIVLDGFKSYAHRTVIGPFDREFNAITGLNGSGKSNIFDAICFVFAISNLNKVRVRDLRELIYKSGQAGIQKATVTIEFDNTDEQKPLGVNTPIITVTRQIMMGGRNKFFINGKSAQLAQVQTMFHSVQLNVNNPHFLIMQGSVTKVINQRPQETLAMLEEAAGTRMFELKKQAALGQLKRKDTRVAEVDRQLEEDISPKLRKLEGEREEYDQYVRAKQEIERIQRLRLAWHYETEKEKLQKGAGEQKELERRAQELKKDADKAAAEARRLTAECQSLREKDTSSLGRAVTAAQKSCDEVNKKLVEVKVELKARTDDEMKAKKAIEKLSAELAKAQQSGKDQEANAQQARKDAAKLEKQHAALEERLQKATQQLQLLRQGVAASAEGVTLTERLRQLTEERVTCEGTVKANAQKIKQIDRELEKRRGRQSGDDAAYRQTKEKLRLAEQELRKRERAISERAGAFDHDAAERLRSELHAAKAKQASLEREVSNLEVHVGGKMAVPWKHGMPRDLDDVNVRGKLALFVKVGEERHFVPLSVVAQTALQQIVVDNEQTAKRVLGEVTQRVTVCPLSKVQVNMLPETVRRRAAQVARAKGGEAHLALDLVDFEPAQVRPAVEFAFGGHLVCTDVDVATAVCFDKDVKARCVTLDGEQVQPGGVMSGGSSKALDQTLQRVAHWRAKEEELAQAREITKKLEARFNQCDQQRGAHQELEDKLEEARRECNELSYELEASKFHRMQQEIQNLETTRQEAEKELSDARARLAEVNEEMDEVQKEMKQHNPEGSKKKVEQEVARLKQELKENTRKLDRARQQALDVDEGEASLQEEVQRVQEEKRQAVAALAEASGERKERQERLTRLQEEKSEKDRAVQQAKRKSEAANKELKQKEQQLTDIGERREELDAEAQKCTLKARALDTETAAAKRRVAELEASDFVKQNRAKFGVSGTDLDWRSVDYEAEFKKLEKLRASNQKAAKTVNQKVLTMHEAVTERYNELVGRRRELQDDRQQMQGMIEELDHQKRRAVRETYESVTGDFSSIFGTLLPGANAKLHAEQDAESGEITGINVRVAMGQTWKEGLTELSGGQRSLLALSLILALLKYKPAPVYILDEVDAALDLSHTQNIGKMLKHHFRDRQFLVVSLKEGMFNNANVLFRVKLVEGQSTVSRWVGGREENGPETEGRVGGVKRVREP